MAKRTDSSMGQRVAFVLIALGLGSVVFGLFGFKKHQRDADELSRLSAQFAPRGELLAPDAVDPAERMARWNLLIWTGVGFSYFGVSLAAGATMLARVSHAKANAADAATRVPAPE